MSTTLKQAIDGLITVFHYYSGREGDRFKLSKAEMKHLLKVELPEYLDGKEECAAVSKIMNDLDANRDGQVDFNEFVSMVVWLTVMFHMFFRCTLKE